MESAALAHMMLTHSTRWRSHTGDESVRVSPRRLGDSWTVSVA